MPALLLTAWFATATALAGEAPEADPAWSHIVNGREVKGQNFPAAVAIGIEFQGQRMAMCSASLIAPRLLLTAAHCTEELGVPKDLIVQVGAAFFGNDVSSDQVRSVKFADFRPHPDYPAGSQQPRSDIGVIELAEDVDWVTPVWFRGAPVSESELDHELISVGFGSTTTYSAQTGSGVKRVANLRLGGVDPQFLYSFASGNPTHSNLCSGDSGGPQYARVNGRLEQWGVHSFVFSPNFNADPCQSASGSTNVGTFEPWVMKQVERVYGTTDKCEILGLYDAFDRYCEADCEEPDPDCEFDLDGDGTLDDGEFAAIDADGDGEVTDDELARARRGGCDHTGGLPGGLALAGVAALAARRRRPSA